jgi:lysine 2,3-aminomutase
MINKSFSKKHQQNKTIRNVDGLVSNKLIAEDEIMMAEQVANEFTVALTEEMRCLIEPHHPDDPIKKQFVPTKAELDIDSVELADPIGDQIHSPVKGIVHRHSDRCLLSPVQICAVYCRFCFRREKMGSGNATLTSEELQTAYDYIIAHPEIWEVILTGGDPLIMKPKSLGQILASLDEIETLQIVRFHTRIPVVDPDRITPAMIKCLRLKNATPYIVLHINHAKELSQSAKKAIAQLIDAGIPLLSQTVLLKGVNDNIEALGELMKALIKIRVKPYYLHHGDLAKGTQHFRTSIEKGQALMRQLRSRFSGLCQPTYVLDIPGGYGKVPINHCYLEQGDECLYVVEDYKGARHAYPPKCKDKV